MINTPSINHVQIVSHIIVRSNIQTPLIEPYEIDFHTAIRGSTLIPFVITRLDHVDIIRFTPKELSRFYNASIKLRITNTYIVSKSLY